MKKFISLLLCLIFVVSLTACTQTPIYDASRTTIAYEREMSTKNEIGAELFEPLEVGIFPFYLMGYSDTNKTIDEALENIDDMSDGEINDIIDKIVFNRLEIVNATDYYFTFTSSAYDAEIDIYRDYDEEELVATMMFMPYIDEINDWFKAKDGDMTALKQQFNVKFLETFEYGEFEGIVFYDGSEAFTRKPVAILRTKDHTLGILLAASNRDVLNEILGTIRLIDREVTEREEVDFSLLDGTLHDGKYGVYAAFDAPVALWLNDIDGFEISSKIEGYEDVVGSFEMHRENKKTIILTVDASTYAAALNSEITNAFTPVGEIRLNGIEGFVKSEGYSGYMFCGIIKSADLPIIISADRYEDMITAIQNLSATRLIYTSDMD